MIMTDINNVNCHDQHYFQIDDETLYIIRGVTPQTLSDFIV